MSYKMRFGKAILVQALAEQLGYPNKQAVRIVNKFVGVLKDALKQGKNVDIEGVGTLQIVERKSRRQIVKGLNHQVPSVHTVYRRTKTVRLKVDPKLKLEVTECPEVVCAETPSPETTP